MAFDKYGQLLSPVAEVQTASLERKCFDKGFKYVVGSQVLDSTIVHRRFKTSNESAVYLLDKTFRMSLTLVPQTG